MDNETRIAILADVYKSVFDDSTRNYSPDYAHDIAKKAVEFIDKKIKEGNDNETN